MKLTRVTLKDVSREAGVSVATVSNVLNVPEKVAPETRERVRAVIDELGYIPSRAAQALQQQRTFAIGYLMPAESELYALDTFLHHMVERAGEAGLDIVLFTPKRGQSEVDAYREMVLRDAVDGFVLSGTNHGDPRVSFLLNAGIPFVTFGRTDLDDRHPWVDVDGRRGVADGVAHLVELGHSRIGLIGVPTGSRVGDQRARGYLDGLAAAGIERDDDLVVRVVNSFESGVRAGATLIERGVTAITAVQDTLALGAMAAARDRGLAIGTDLAVVGFDDTPSAATAYPPLTSVHQPMAEVGGAVVELLVAKLGADAASVEPVVLTPRLVIRQSSTGGLEGMSSR